ncbi:MAG: hypothetical protein KKB21_00040 [Nanoarchaeota archaeon]|nr:hypothetical protein [Nanoarchaeota archaeon]MBU4085949.1 hypothetical protein [Nanoarchaeota archaeon]
MEKVVLGQQRYIEFSEKERFLREILCSGQLIAQKREFCRETLSCQIREKGVKNNERERKEDIIKNC